MKITDRINFRQPKYMLPAIVYLPLLVTGYCVCDLFDTDLADTPNKELKTTEFLNPDLPGAKIREGDDIGGKYENMAKSYGRIDDYSALDNIDRDNPEDQKEEYESKYTQDDLDKLAKQDDEKAKAAAEAANVKARETEALAELEKALAEARLKGQQQATVTEKPDTTSTPPEKVTVKGKVEVENKGVKALSDKDKATEVVKKVKVSSDYFNTLTQNEHEAKLIKAIIDEDVKATDGSRIRLRLLDDIEINEAVVPKGSYLYATMSGFSSQRVKGNVNSIMVDDELLKVSLSLYDTDGIEGLYVPSSSFRETTKDVASGAMSSTMNINDGTSSGNTLSQWGMQTIQNAYQKTSNAISKAIKKNKVKLKYGTFVYLINSKETNKNK
jgi:conjugative transposon TraM protein